MAKPKGATLTQLFAVSDKEREQFWAKIRPDQKEGIPESGAPPSAIPHLKTHVTGDPDLSQAPDVVKNMPVAAAILGFVGSTSKDSPHTPETGTPGMTVPVRGVPVSGIRRKVREAMKVQDGHSLGEQVVYAALWAEGHSYSEECRRITVGYRSVSDLCGLTVNNCKANLLALRQKLAIEELAAATPTQGTTYLVYSYQAILRRRRQAGMTHVIKTKGVQFVNPLSGAPVSGAPERLRGVPETGTATTSSGTPAPAEKGVPVSDPPIRNKNLLQETGPEGTPPSPSSFPAVTAAARQYGLTLDDDAVRRIVLRSQAFDDTASEVEVAYFLAVKIQQLGSSSRVGNWPGLLIKAVPEYFASPATELQHFRQAVREEEQRQIQRAQERVELARSTVADPHADEQERAWAEAVLAERPPE